MRQNKEKNSKTSHDEHTLGCGLQRLSRRDPSSRNRDHFALTASVTSAEAGQSEGTADARSTSRFRAGDLVATKTTRESPIRPPNAPWRARGVIYTEQDQALSHRLSHALASWETC
jgi:hypothetical protein